MRFKTSAVVQLSPSIFALLKTQSREKVEFEAALQSIVWSNCQSEMSENCTNCHNSSIQLPDYRSNRSREPAAVLKVTPVLFTCSLCNFST